MMVGPDRIVPLRARNVAENGKAQPHFAFRQDPFRCVIPGNVYRVSPSDNQKLERKKYVNIARQYYHFVFTPK